MSCQSMSTVVPMGFAEIRESVIVMSFARDPAVITDGSIMLTLAVSERVPCVVVLANRQAFCSARSLCGMLDTTSDWLAVGVMFLSTTRRLHSVKMTRGQSCLRCAMLWGRPLMGVAGAMPRVRGDCLKAKR